MPQVEWVIANRVYRMRYQGVVTLADFKEGYRLSRAMLDQAENTLHILVDLQQVEDMLPTPTEIAHLPNVFETTQHPRRGWTVHCGNNPLYKQIAEGVSEAYEIKNHWCETEAEALAFLRIIDPYLQSDHNPV